MKKILAIILSLALLFTLFGCSAKQENGEDNSTTAASGNTEYTTQAAAYKSSGKSSGTSFETVLDTNEYAMYYNIFYNDQGGDYDGKPVFKKGTFATLYDEYNEIVRYYVWGYNDQTKCCDWQWELKYDDVKDVPSNGSLVEVTGTFASDENALDGYWITEPKITVKSAYKGADVDIDMSTMSATLERVQAFYIINKYPNLEGKTVRMYGRVMDDKTIQHPYYNETDFKVEIETEDEMPAIGMMVMVQGTVFYDDSSDYGKIINASVKLTEDY